MKKGLVLLFHFLLINSVLSQTTEKNLAEIITVDGQQHYGYILHATDTLLFLWQSKDPFNPEMIEKFVSPFYFFDLKRVTIKREGHFWPALKKGALIGGGVSLIILAIPTDDPYSGAAKGGAAGIIFPSSLFISGIIGGVKDKDHVSVCNGKIELYNKILPHLIKDAIFPYRIPSELQAYKAEKLKQLLSKETSSQISDQLRKQFYYVGTSKFHVLISSGFIISKIDNDIMDTFSSSGYSGEKEYPDPEYPSFFNFEAEYNLTENFCVGIELANMRMRRITSGPIREEADRSSISLIFDYIILPLNNSLLKKSEFAIGTGFSYNSLSFNQTITVKEFELDNKVFGGCVKASFDYYLLKDFSVQFKVNGRLIPPIDVYERSYENYVIKKHQLNFSAIDFSFGMRLHF